MKSLLVLLSVAGVLAVSTAGLVSCGGNVSVSYHVGGGPAHSDAKARLESFLKEELARLSKGPGADAAVIKTWCTTELAQLLAVEDARGVAFNEGFEAAKGDPANKEKPPFADSGYFIGATVEGEMSAAVEVAPGQAASKDRVKLPVAFTSTEGGKSHDQGKQTVVMVYENSVWKIADVEFSDGASLVTLLKRPKYMELPVTSK